jgi:hypothetical protein
MSGFISVGNQNALFSDQVATKRGGNEKKKELFPVIRKIYATIFLKVPMQPAGFVAAFSPEGVGNANDLEAI